jgi:general nucleoside transport system permease protein
VSERVATATRPRGAVLGITGSRRQIGILGIALGVFAAWLALPPVSVRSPVWPVIVAVAAVAAGAWAILGEERRVGWGAVASGVLGAVSAILAQQSSAVHLEEVFVWGALLGATLRFATPLVFAAIGGMFSERSGVVNIALEGMMLVGAFFGIWGADKTGSWVGGLVIAMAAGGAFALLHAFFAVHLRADQIVGGTAINFLALGITGYLFIAIYTTAGTGTGISEIPNVHLPWLDRIPPERIGHFLDDAIGNLNLMIWISLALLVVSSIVMFRTPIGLRIRAVGEHPRAADTVGISVYRVRYAAVTLSGVLAAMGGAYLSIGFVHSFNENMTAGRGFIALAALIFGNWRPFGAFGAACLFGFSSALAQRLGPAYGSQYDTLFQALPYALTLIAVAGVIGRSIPPAAVGRPYKKQ